MALEGSVVGGLRTYISAPFSNQCADIEDFTFEISSDFKHFTLDVNEEVEIPFGDNTNPLFWIIVEAIPGESVAVDITDLSFWLDGAVTACTNITINQNGTSYGKSTPSTCTESDLEVVFGTPSVNILGVTEIPLYLNHSETTINLYEFDVQFEVVDFYGNLENVYFEGELPFSADNLGGSGTWTTYAFLAYPGNSAYDPTDPIGYLFIEGPTADNVQAEVDITFEFSRVSFENSTAQYCCSPDFVAGAQNVVIQSGLLPCDDVSSIVLEGNNSPDPSTCPDSIYFDVFFN